MEGKAYASLVKVVVENVINISNEDISLPPRVKKNADKLSSSLDTVLKFLNHAETHTNPTEDVKGWLKKLENAAFDADNVLDELKYHLLSQKINNIAKPSTKAKLPKRLSLDNYRSQKRWADKIMEVNEKLKSINDEAAVLHLDVEIVDAHSPIMLPHVASSRQTASFPADPIFVGRDGDVQKLADLLTNTTTEDREFSILVIQGMGGIGKTRLTKKLFNHPKIQTRFGESRIWVHVSQSFDSLILLKDILKELLIDQQVDSRAAIEKMLQEALKGKTYLLVLDDVWNEDLPKWKDFMDSITGVSSTMGNAIIITTRKEQVALTEESFRIDHQLNLLTDEDCWSIIKAKALHDGDDPLGDETTCLNIARKCHGLPLTAKIVGELLYKAPKEKWISIEQKWLSEDERQLQSISQILKLSFDNLPSPSLKKCFAYCSIFPKGHRIVKEELIELWMAEGFLQPDEKNDEKKDMEYVGNKFLNVLLHNSLLLVAKRDVYGHIERCMMHDIVHDIASSILAGSNRPDDITPVRYMIPKGKSSPISKQVGKHLRTLFWEGEVSDNMFSNLESLHNLTLTRVKELPNSIGKLIHLRNLNISESRVRELPEWIGELHHLQTIRAITEHLRSLPSKVTYLFNLRHLYVLSRVKLPAEIRRLTNLRTLNHFAVGNDKGYEIEELGSLENLKGKLEIHNLEKVHGKEEALKAKLFEKQNLSELLFDWDMGRPEGQVADESVLEGLQPHENITKLHIRGFKGKRFPVWRVLLINLIELTLERCLECEEMPKLEDFPKLTKLEIYNCPKLREFADGLDTLGSLRELLIEDCPNMKSIGNPSGGRGQSQGLRSLRIEDCGGLMALPHQMVDSWAPSLEILLLKGLSSLENLPTVINSLTKSTRLVELEIRSVPNFTATCSIPRWPFGCLKKLTIDVNGESSVQGSVSIEGIVDGMLEGCRNSLTQLCLIGKERWTQVPKSIQRLAALSRLELQKLGIKILPQWFGGLSSLRRLFLSDCKKLKCLPSGDALERLTKLQTLDVKDCPRLRITPQRRRSRHLTIKVDDRWMEPSSNEVVDGRMSTAAIEVLLQNLIHALEKDRPVIRFPNKVAQKLKDSLDIIKGYLNDAENKSIEEDAVKVWLRDVEAAAFNADNVLDELIYHLLNKNLVKKMKMHEAENKVLSTFLSLKHVARRRNMSLKIKQINTSFKSVKERAITEHDLQTINANATAQHPPDAFIPNPIFVGRDGEVAILVEKLTHIPRGNIFSILAIFGVDGVGKTTLTRKIFNHEDVKARFGSRIWVHVSQIFDPIMVLKNILSTLASQATDGAETLESVLERLQEALKGKPYLLILEDVWNNDLPKWEAFVNFISGVTSTRGNAIIITTRNEEVASLVKPLHIHPLNILQDSECWSIIRAKTFGNSDMEYEKIGEKIAKLCWRLPLIVNVVGGILLGDQDWKTWLTDVKGYHMYDFLRLSFDNLSSPSMKMCFAYCSIFPKGHIIVKQELVELWMAEGFLQADEINDMESMGNNFFNVFLHKSLLQVAETDAYGNVESCVMHDLVHDLASAVLGSSDCNNQVRYLVRGSHDSSPIPEGTEGYLRTLIFQSKKIDTNMFSGFKSLHALTLDCNGLMRLPSSIRGLIHLRKLNISRTRIEKFPDWIFEFRHLQTLNALTKSLRELPSTLKYLISLRHLYIPLDVELPVEIGRLTNLQALKFRVGEQKGYMIEELGNLKNLKQVSIQNMEKVRDKEEADKAKLYKKEKLKVLELKWGKYGEGEKNDKGVLEGLKPPQSLEKLGIVGFKGEKFPSWIVELNNVMDITLDDCQECTEVPSLGHLPNLKSLSLVRLSNMKSINSSFYGIANAVSGVIFPKLETVLLKDMDKLTEWAKVEFANEVAFPHLQSLKIQLCNKLKCLPSWLFSKAHNLKELDIKHCSELRELPDGLHTLKSLESMTIRGCQNLRSIAYPSGGGQTQGSLDALRSLEIRDCQELKVMVVSWAMPALKKVCMAELKSLENLPRFLGCLAKSNFLQELTIVGIPNFVPDMGVEIWPLCKLEKLEVDVSREWSHKSSVAIKKAVNGILQKSCSSLAEVKLTGIEVWEFVSLPLRKLTALYSLELENFGVRELPEWFGKLSSLRKLSLSNFTKLERLPLMQSPTTLQELHIRNCPLLRIDYESHKISRRCAIFFNGHRL